MRRIAFIITILAALATLVMLLAACSPADATEEVAAPTEAIATQAVVAPTDTEAPPPTDVLTTEPAPIETTAPAGGAVSYKIVAGESSLQYEVGEVFINDNNRFNLAVGVTPQVEGEILVDMAAPQNSTIGAITADISQFKSDSNRRDGAIRDRFLESATYPTVTFVATSIDGLPAAYTEGEQIILKITGDLTIREVTKPVVFDGTVQLSAGTLSGTAVTTILMSDFEFGPIDILGMLKTEDQAKITLTLVARP
jgi:polyisoprenoid-binding protein YceI